MLSTGACPLSALKIDFWSDIMPINLWAIPPRPMGLGQGQGLS